MSSTNISSIETVRFLRSPNIADQLLGLTPIDVSLIKDYEDLQNLYHIRHDLIHALICDHRGVIFGEKALKDILMENNFTISDYTYFDLVEKQSPDIFIMKSNIVDITEISISRLTTMEKHKLSKYALLSYFLQRNGLHVNMEIIVIDPYFVLASRDKLMTTHKLPSHLVDKIKEICDNCKLMEIQLKSTQEGSLLFLQNFDTINYPNSIHLNNKDVIDVYRSSQNKTFHSEEDLMSVLDSDISSYVDQKDHDFINGIVKECKKMTPSLVVSQKFNESDFIRKINSESIRLNGKLQTEPRSIFPLPYISLKSVDASVRSTLNDGIESLKMATKMIRSDDPILSHIGQSFTSHYSKIKNNEDFPFEVHFNKEMNSLIALEGPNRKKYLRRPDFYPEHAKRQREHTLYSLAYETNVSELHDLSMQFSRIDEMNDNDEIYKDSETLSKISGFGLEYVKLCQSIYREVNINSLRKDRRRKFILKPTGIIGVFVLLYKGVKLRTGELVSQIWFKVLVDNEVRSFKNVNPGWAFKKLNNSGSLSHSGWLTTDAHRLDHYLRCYDKILMSYYTLMSVRYRTTYIYKKDDDQEITDQKNKSMMEAIKNDNTNMLGLIIMIYMEDRRSTSKLLQNVRYLVMTLISIYKFPNEVMDKCSEAVRSPLQLFLLKRMVNFISSMETFKIHKNFTAGDVRLNKSTNTYLDALGGVKLMLPRPIIHDRDSYTADFTEILSEMYFCMLFNKNQDDPTHASFQILSKMLEGEESMQTVKSEGNHLGYRKDMTNLDWAKHIIQKPHTHQFSSKAIEIGAKLVRERSGDKFAADITMACQKLDINKSLDEFATFKASANVDTLVHKSTNLNQNSRRRCLEAVSDLINEGCVTSVDVANKYLTHPTEFQIFKKNQIGGVREILILTMISRIKINIIETISRNICSYDERETLTHGQRKNESIKEALYSAKKLPGKRMSMFFSLDKSRWGPSFVPIQFLYLFTPFKKQLGTFFHFILSQLILHQNKKCILPERLIRSWINDPENLLKHRKDENLQNLKEKFLRDKLLYFINESNMGQGILHYTSSYLHSAMISFRDELYKRLCFEYKIDSNDHFDLFSSDDSFTVMSLEIHKISVAIRKLDLFMRAQEVSERLFNCSTSKSKSSINPIIGEFNSLFMSNVTFFPTVLKYSIASVHPPNTDSFFRMVKESYAASRQIVENGGTLDLYMISQYMNKRYCEEIYHTYPGGVNDPRSLNVNKFCYQLGEYPIFNPSLMLMFGPEYHNFLIWYKKNELSEDEMKLFKTCHKIMKGGLVETMAELDQSDTMLGGLLRIEACMGPIKQLKIIRSRVQEKLMSVEEMETLIIEDPLIMFKPTEDLKTVKFKTMQKLMTPGSKEALKTITSSIYYGRMSATVSANAFRISNDHGDPRTYLDCLKQLLYTESEIRNMDDHIKFLYPRWAEYSLFTNDVFKPVPRKLRSIFEIQTIRTLSIFKIGTRLNNSIYNIVKYMWTNFKPPEHEENRYLRDVLTLKRFYPMIKSTIQETKDQFSGGELEKTKAIIMMLLKMYSLRDRTIKCIIFGGSTNDVKETYYVLSERNSTVPFTHVIESQSIRMKTINKINFDEIFLNHNYYLLAKIANNDNLAKKAIKKMKPEIISAIMLDNRLSKNVKKRLFMILLSENMIDNVEMWSKELSVILHYWDVRQKYNVDEKTYTGPFDITLFMGNNRLKVKYNDRMNRYCIYKTNFNDPSLLFEMLNECAELTQTTIQNIVDNTESGDWIVKDNTILPAPGSGIRIMILLDNPRLFKDRYTLDINDSFTSLHNSDGSKLLSIKTGLLITSLRYTKLPNFRVFDLDFKDILKLGCMGRDFDLHYIPLSEIKSVIRDLVVPRPRISEDTIRRLNLSKNWSVRDIKPNVPEHDVEIVSVSPNENRDLIDWLLQDDVDIKTISKEVIWGIDDLYDFAYEFFNTSLFDNPTFITEVQFPTKLFVQTKNLKYDCISMLTTSDAGVNSQTIRSINTLLDKNKKYVLFSLISRYDRLVASSGSMSPNSVMIRIDPVLYDLGVTKFGDDDEIDI